MKTNSYLLDIENTLRGVSLSVVRLKSSVDNLIEESWEDLDAIDVIKLRTCSNHLNGVVKNLEYLINKQVKISEKARMLRTPYYAIEVEGGYVSISGDIKTKKTHSCKFEDYREAINVANAYGFADKCVYGYYEYITGQFRCVAKYKSFETKGEGLC